MEISEHELLVFQRVKRALAKIAANDGMKVKSSGSLAEVLGQLGCLPYAEIPYSFDLDCELSVAGKPAGTFEKPDVDLILKESTASSFGKGESTVLDPEYRNGKEIHAEKLGFPTKGSYKWFLDFSKDEISAAMFVDKAVKLNFYKLAVYEEGGHFDWHMDTTHSDQHHATLLLALNTSWEGGELKLRRNGVETSVNMHPKVGQGDAGTDFQAVAFYTDTEHKVEPVTKGIRIVLQYDVEVLERKKNVSMGWRGPIGSDGSDDESEDEGLLENMENVSKKRKRHQDSSASLAADNASITKVTDIIKSLLADDEEVAFAMQHLYRKSSILPEFLKGTDAQLYRALVSSFDVSLRPVVLHSATGDEGGFEPFLAIPWDHKPGTEDDSDLESDAEGEGDEDGTDSESKQAFHVPPVSAIRKLSHQGYVEYTGNEAQPGEKKYFGGGMFVRLKKVAEKQ